MTTDYNHIADLYKLQSELPWRLYIENPTCFKHMGDLRAKSVLDLACGEGHYTREIKKVDLDKQQGLLNQ